MARSLRHSSRRGAGPFLLGATASALAFQFGHLIEHSLQMGMWFAHPQRTPWMSPWATELALTLGRIPATESGEMSSAMQRGMEVLHLIGNLIFLAGAIGLSRLVAKRDEEAASVRGWARAGIVIQSLHTLEHVALTASVFLSGRAVGLSTWFGSLDGTLMTTQRVWWHGLVNLLASALVGRAVWLVVTGARTPSAKQSIAEDRLNLLMKPRFAALAGVAAVLIVPTLLSVSLGQSATSTDESALHSMDPDGSMQTGQGHAGVVVEGEGLVDVAAAVGLDSRHSAFRWDVSGDPVAMMGGGLCWIDVDQDGWLDLFVTDTWSDGEWALWNDGPGLPTTRIYRNDEGRFVDATERWGAGFPVRAVGCITADLDGDLDPDLYVTTSRSNLLLLNRDGEGFDEVAADAGADTYGWQAGVAAGDLNADGLTDLVLAGYADLNAPRDDSDSGFPNTVAARRDVILFGLGVVDGIPRFEAADTEALGLEPNGPEYGLDVVLVDIDGDSDLDIHLANDTQANRMYRNDLADGGGFVDIAPSAGLADEGSGMGVAMSDLNGDTVPDLGLTNLAGQGHRVFLSGDLDWSTGTGAIEDLGNAETGWGIAFPDLDSDGTVDSVVVSGDIPIVSDTNPYPVNIFQGQGSGTFVPWPMTSMWPDLPNVHGRSVAPADYDNDGDIDLAISSIGSPLVLLENRLPQGRSLTIDLGNGVAGTVVRVELDDGSTIEHRVGSGGHWLSSPDQRVHFGLGDRWIVGLVAIEGPSGEIGRFEVPPEGGFLRWRAEEG